MNTQINIADNGTTTLATAGKYCDRNIDVNVNVPTYETELAEQKAITDSIVDETITTYFNDTVTFVRPYAFRYCGALERAEFTKVTAISTFAFGNCKVLAKFIIRTESVCILGNTNVFANIDSSVLNIYVPDSLVDSYKTATNWSTYADQIKPISELEE